MPAAWSSWIDHDGKGCPLPVGTAFQAKVEGSPGRFHSVEDRVSGRCKAWDWTYWLKPTGDADGSLWAKVVRYRWRKPDALLELREIAAGKRKPERRTRKMAKA